MFFFLASVWLRLIVLYVFLARLHVYLGLFCYFWSVHSCFECQGLSIVVSFSRIIFSLWSLHRCFKMQEVSVVEFLSRSLFVFVTSVVSLSTCVPQTFSSSPVLPLSLFGVLAGRGGEG